MGLWKSIGEIAGDIGGGFIGDPMLGHQIGSFWDASQGGPMSPNNPDNPNHGPYDPAWNLKVPGQDKLWGSGATTDLATVLGGAAKGAQSQNNISDQLKLALGNYGLNRDKFALDAPATRLSTGSKSAIAAALAKAGPTTVNWGGPGSGLKGMVPSFGGGAHDALASLKDNPDYMNLLDLVGKDSLAGEKAGGITGGGKDSATPDYLKNIGQSSFADKLLGGGAFGSSILAALQKNGMFKRGGPNGGPGGGYNPNGPDGDFPTGATPDEGGFDPSTFGFDDNLDNEFGDFIPY